MFVIAALVELLAFFVVVGLLICAQKGARFFLGRYMGNMRELDEYRKLDSTRSHKD